MNVIYASDKTYECFGTPVLDAQANEVVLA